MAVEPFDVFYFEPPEKVPTHTYKSVNERTGKIETTVRIDWDWYEREITARARELGYNAVVLHTTAYWHRKWGLRGFNGIHRTDADDIAEVYFQADRLEEFKRLFLHEFGHFGERRTNGGNNVPTVGCGSTYSSQVHKADYCDKDLVSFWASLDFSKWKSVHNKAIQDALQALSLISQVLVLMKIIKDRAVYPIRTEFFLNRVSRRFGLSDPARRSGIHNGLDLAVPVGTPIVAPRDGEVYQCFSWHQSMGNAIYFKGSFKDEEYYIRFLHLLKPGVQGRYKKGDVIGFTGNTGDSTGPHLHVEVWRVPIDTKILYKESSVRQYLVDPFKFFRYHVDDVIV